MRVPDADWANAPTQFVGWVPNVLGHLSFSLIGHGTPPDAHCACAEIGATQEVVAFQTRQADDRAVHRWIARWTRPRSVHDWLLISKSAAASYPSSKNSPAARPKLDIFEDKRGMLRGTIHLLGGKSWKTSGFWGQFAFRRKRFEYRSAIIRALRDLRRSDTQSSSPDATAERILAEAKENGLEFGRVEFCLFRTGEVRIWFADDQPVANDGAMRTVAKIAYFFLKDIAHLHTHHHHSQDGMIPFCQLESHDAEGEKSWQRRTIWALSRSIEEYVRRGTRTDLKAAIGMIPYAESFHSLYGGLYREPGELNQFEAIQDHEFDHYSFEGLRKMVASLLDSRNSTLTIRTALAAALIPITLSSIIAVNAVGNSTDKHAQWPVCLKAITSNYPLWVVPIIWALLLLVYGIAYREARLDEAVFMPVRTFTRMAKAIAVSLNRLIGFPPRVGYFLILAAQLGGLWILVKFALDLPWRFWASQICPI